jgi:hypothetical protein
VQLVDIHAVVGAYLAHTEKRYCRCMGVVSRIQTLVCHSRFGLTVDEKIRREHEPDRTDRWTDLVTLRQYRYR